MKFWTKEKCLIEALKFKTRNEFCSNSSKAYFAARRHKWIDDICEHMVKCGNAYNRAIYSFEFPDKRVYVGLTHNLNKRKNEHLSSERSSVFKYISISGLTPEFKILTDYIDISISTILEGDFIEKYKTDSWIILNKKNMVI